MCCCRAEFARVCGMVAMCGGSLLAQVVIARASRRGAKRHKSRNHQRHRTYAERHLTKSHLIFSLDLFSIAHQETRAKKKTGIRVHVPDADLRDWLLGAIVLTS